MSVWQSEEQRCAVVLREVFCWLGAVELARAGAACRAWRRAAAEPALWRRLLRAGAHAAHATHVSHGIYAGDGKPSDLDAFLGPFVAEMIQLQDGFTVATKSQREIKVHVKIRAFICDSPARAMIKGVSNFNSKNGCLKCTVVGEYSHRSNTVSFHRIDCTKRNNDDFRAKKYGQHHIRLTVAQAQHRYD